MKPSGSWFSRAWIVLLVAGIVIALDQWTKNLVRANVPKFEPVPVLGEWLQWQHIDNNGAAFGLFQNGRMFFTIAAIAISIGILFYIRYIPSNKKLLLVLLGMMLGGAVGNLIDRIQQGYVTDFVRMGIPGVYYWPNWNVADASIVCGVIGLVIYVIWEDLSTARRAKQEVTENASSK